MRYLIAFVVVVILGLAILPGTAQAATFTVTKTADTNDGTCDADCSLREAVVAANANSGADVVNFNIPTSDGGYNSSQLYWSLPLNSTLSLSDASGVFINGYSQTGSSRNTAAFGEPLNTILKIDLHFTAGNIAGIISNNHLAGMAIRVDNISNLIDLNNATNNWIEGNFFGSDITGTSSSGGDGIDLKTGSNSNTIGTNGDGVGDAGERNLFIGSGSLSDNRGTLQLNSSSDNNVIAGNYIGVNKTGRSCGTGVMNRAQITVNGSGNRIGTNYDGVSDSEEVNLIGCINSDSRGQIRIAGGNNGLIQGNYIGTNAFGDDLSNFNVIGIVFRDAASSGWIVKRNIIAYNRSGGVQVQLATNLNHRITQNLIYNNDGSNSFGEIDLNFSISSQSNDSGDIDTGPNNGMNYPVINTAEYVGGSKYRLTGIMDSAPGERPITIEVFKSNGESTLHGGSIAYLGAVNPLPNGNWEAIVDVPGEENTRRVYFTTTATNVNGDTSEFSLNAFVGGSDPQKPSTPGPTTSTPKPTAKPKLVSKVFVSGTPIPTHTPETKPTPSSEPVFEQKNEVNAEVKSDLIKFIPVGILFLIILLLILEKRKKHKDMV